MPSAVPLPVRIAPVASAAGTGRRRGPVANEFPVLTGDFGPAVVSGSRLPDGVVPSGRHRAGRRSQRRSASVTSSGRCSIRK